MADFLLVLLLLLILVVLHQSITNGHLRERMAVDRLQHYLWTPADAKTGKAPAGELWQNAILKSAASSKPEQFKLYRVDGDLQRFSFIGDTFFAPGSASL